MTDGMYHVAVIGCGRVGALYEADPKRPKPASHAGSIAAHPETELVALVDTNAAALAKAGKLFPKARCYRSVQQCLAKEKPDIVAIATPPNARLSILKECIKHGVRAVVCEKPLANSVKEAREIARVAKKSSIVFVLNYPRRLASLFARVRREIASGALGQIQHVTCYYSNGLYNNGGHAVDTLLFLLGEGMEVRWAGVNKSAVHPPGDPCVDAVLETKRGTRIVLQSADQSAYGIFDIRVLGTKGERVFTDYSATLIETPVRASLFKEVRQLDRAHARVRKGKEGSALTQALKALGGRKRTDGAEQGLAVMRILDTIRHAAKKK